jgi:hypothetical protein
MVTRPTTSQTSPRMMLRKTLFQTILKILLIEMIFLRLNKFLLRLSTTILNRMRLIFLSMFQVLWTTPTTLPIMLPHKITSKELELSHKKIQFIRELQFKLSRSQRLSTSIPQSRQLSSRKEKNPQRSSPLRQKKTPRLFSFQLLFQLLSWLPSLSA